ncbi:MAG: helicase-associated domain-containing protein [Clostridiales bacterium]|jgi:hypothetical protein|nr:helicase-associated domain-containing protein [Clostridiales bacterium]
MDEYISKLSDSEAKQLCILAAKIIPVDKNADFRQTLADIFASTELITTILRSASVSELVRIRKEMPSLGPFVPLDSYRLSSEHTVFDLLRLSRSAFPIVAVEAVRRAYSALGLHEATPLPDDRIIAREGRIGDLSQIAVFFSKKSFAVDSNGMVTKATLALMQSFGGWDEVAELQGAFCSPKEAKTRDGLKVSSALYIIARTAFLQSGNNEILSLPAPALAKKAYSLYMNTNDTPESTLICINKISVYSRSFETPKKILEHLLKQCPVGKFVSFDSFDQAIKLRQPAFFQCAASFYRSGFNIKNPWWEECEQRFIELYFGALCALGMVDLAWRENVRLHETFPPSVAIHAFRLTSLGAWILDMPGAVPPEVEEEPEGGLIAATDLTILIDGKKSKAEHEPFFARYFERISESDSSATYKLSIGGIIKALEEGLTVRHFVNYLKENCSMPVPDNVLHTLSTWEIRTATIKISKVVLLETDDKYLLAEIGSAFPSAVIRQSAGGLVLVPGSESKLKKGLNKDGRFVIIESEKP